MRALPFALGFSALLVVASAASADERPPTPVAPPLGSTTVVAPPGSGGVTVVAPTPGGGTVTATGCTSVVVNGSPTMVAPGGGPCPTYAPYQPYQPAYGPPGYGQPTYGQPMYAERPRYARDPDRTGAVIASSVVFGVGAGIAGLIYLVQYNTESCSTAYDTASGYSTSCSSNHTNARTALLTYGAIVTLTPSIPRFVVGDTTKGLIYTAIRGGAFATAALVNWGDKSDSWTYPFLLGFVVPITLGIVDLATTPHREDVEAQKAGITGVTPEAVAHPKHGATGAQLSEQGHF
jgi:hypothetical protein